MTGKKINGLVRIMEKQAAYKNLADWFEYLNDDCGYENWSQYLILQLKAFPLARGLDIGCGSGRFTRDFQKARYSMTGLDVSVEMLARAKALSDREGLRIPYLLGDITRFKSFEKFDFATAVNDCVNYIPKKKLLSAFKNVYAALNKNGIFLFDISSERKFREKIANTVSADDREEITYLSFNAVEDDVVTMDVTLFIRREDGAFERCDERHTQYIYTEEEIVSALRASGFEVLKIEGHLGEEKSVSDRVCFLAKKP